MAVDPCVGPADKPGERAADALGMTGDERVRLVRLGKDVNYLVTRLMDFAFAVRKHPVGRLIARRLLDQGDRARQLSGRFVEPWARRVARWTPAERQGFHKALLDAERVNQWPTVEQMAALPKNVADGVRDYRRLMHRSLQVINVVRRAHGQEPIEGIQGVYFPHEFAGNFHLEGADGKRVMTRGGSGWDTQADALEAAFQHLATNPKARLSVVADYTSKLANVILRDPAEYGDLFETLDAVSRGSSLSPDEVADAYTKGVRKRGFRTHLLAREGRPGYDTENVYRVIDKYLRMLSWWAPAEMARADIHDTLLPRIGNDEPHLKLAVQNFMSQVYGKPGGIETAIDQTLNTLMESPAMRVVARAVMPYEHTPLVGPIARRLNPLRFNPVRPTQRLSQAGRGITADLKLGLMNYAVAITHTLHMPTNIWPTLGTKYLVLGLRDTMMNDPEVTRAYHWGEKHGVFRAHLMDDAPGGPLSRFIATGTKGMSEPTREIINFIWRPIGLSERVLRQVGFFGSLRALRDQGVVGERLLRLASDDTMKGIPELGKFQERFFLEQAKRVNELVNFRYDRASRPPWATGAFGQILGQFKTFITGTIALEKRMWDLGGKERLRGLAPMGVMLALGGISGGIPFAHMLDDAVKYATGGGDPNAGFSPLDAVYTNLVDAVGSRRAQVYYRGLPALAGMDATRRIGFSHIHLERPLDFLGATTATINDFITYLHFHDLEHLGMVAPGISNLATAWQWAQDEMARDPFHRDRLRFTPTQQDIAKRALGMEPLDQAMTTDMLRITGRAEAQEKRTRTQLIDALIDAAQRNDDAALDTLLDQAAESETPITVEDLQRELKAKQTPALERRLKSLPKAMRPKYLERAGPELEDEAERQRAAAALRAAQGK